LRASASTRVTTGQPLGFQRLMQNNKSVAAGLARVAVQERHMPAVTLNQCSHTHLHLEAAFGT
jgi:uncharacterized phage-associated protein